jgi:cold shock protein
LCLTGKGPTYTYRFIWPGFGYSRRQRLSTRQFLPNFSIVERVRGFCGAKIRLRTTYMPTGTVKFYNGQKGFGFIQPEDGSKDVFVHISALDRAGLGGLVEGQKVEFDVEQGRDGRSSAANLKAL